MSGRKDKQDVFRRNAKLLAKLNERGMRYPEDLDDDDNGPIILGYFQAVCEFFEPLSTGYTAAGLRQAVRTSNDLVDRLLEGMPNSILYSDRGEVTIACRSGCNFCCHARVTARAPFILAIAFYLKKKLSPGDLESVIERLKSHSDETEKQSPDEQVNSSRLCPLNLGGLCLAYPYRPFGCRGHHSFDREICRVAFTQGDESIELPRDEERIGIAGLVSRATKDTLAALGLNTDVLELAPALVIALTEPDVEERYLAGERVFYRAFRPEVLIAEENLRARLSLTQLPQVPRTNR